MLNHLLRRSTKKGGTRLNSLKDLRNSIVLPILSTIVLAAATILVLTLMAISARCGTIDTNAQYEYYLTEVVNVDESPPPVLLKEERHEPVDAAYSLALNRAVVFEGFSETPYLLQGEWHIGFGRLIESPEYFPRVTLQEAYTMLQDDMSVVEEELNQRLPYFNTSPIEMRLVLLDMGYNMGVPRLMKFKRMHSAARVSDWNKVAAEMIDSLYFNQVHNRASSNVMLVLELIQDTPQGVN